MIPQVYSVAPDDVALARVDLDVVASDPNHRLDVIVGHPTASDILAHLLTHFDAPLTAIRITSNGALAGYALLAVVKDHSIDAYCGVVPLLYIAGGKEGEVINDVLRTLAVQARHAHLFDVQIHSYAPLLLGWLEEDWTEVFKGFASPPPGAYALQSRWATEDDFPVVSDLWRRAIEAGLPASRRALCDPEAPAHLARTMLGYALLHCGGILITGRDKTLGLAVFSRDWPDVLTGRPYFFLHDIFITPEHRSAGHFQRLNADVEAVARLSGAPGLVSTVKGTTGAATAKILERIAHQGWQPVRWVYRLNLAQAPAAGHG